MIFPETALERDQFPPVGEKTRLPDRLPEQRPWARDPEITASATSHHGRPWIGVAVAMSLALGFWVLVWLAVDWATGL